MLTISLNAGSLGSLLWDLSINTSGIIEETQGITITPTSKFKEN